MPPATAVAPSKAKQKLPFRAGTRRRFQTLGQYTFTPGAPIPTINLPQVGMLSRIFWKVEGPITLSAPGVMSPDGYAALFARVGVSANLGSASIVNVTGVGLEVLNKWVSPAGLPVQNTFGNAAGDNTVEFGGVITINANDRNQFAFGLIDLQAPEVRVSIDVLPAPLASFITNATGSALTLYLAYEYWEVPDPTRYALPPRTVVRILEEAPMVVQATGDQTYLVPRMGTLAQMSHVVTLNSVRANIATTVDSLRMVINKTDTIMAYASRFKEIDEADLYNRAGSTFLEDGILTWDFYHSDAQTFNAGGRDLYNTEEVTTLESIIAIDGAANIGGTSNIKTVRRILQRLV